MKKKRRLGKFNKDIRKRIAYLCYQFTLRICVSILVSVFMSQFHATYLSQHFKQCFYLFLPSILEQPGPPLSQISSGAKIATVGNNSLFIHQLVLVGNEVRYTI